MIYCMRTRIFFPVNNTDYLLVPNYRILSSHGISRTVTDFLFLFLSRIIEFSNFCLHTEYRGRSRIFFFVTNFLFSCPELSNYRISITRNITDSHGFLSCPELSNYRILSFLSRDCPWSRDLSLDPLTAGR